MKKDFYSYAKLELLETARVQIACNENITKEQRTSIINDLNEEYIQTINEAEGAEFKTAQDMIGDISSSYKQDEATEIIMHKLFCENYAFQDEVYELAESVEMVDYFDKTTSYASSEDVSFNVILDNIKEQAEKIETVASETDFSM